MADIVIIEQPALDDINIIEQTLREIIIVDETQPPEMFGNDYNDLINVPPLTYTHEFNASDLGHIVINHGMKKKPGIYVEDSAGTQWQPASIQYPNLDIAIVDFSINFGGKVICS